MQQRNLLPAAHFNTTFGGALLKSNPKVARTFSPKSAMHIVMKSSLVKKEKSFFKHKKIIDKLVRKQAKRHFIKIYAWQNVGNHLHFVLQTKLAKNLRAFLRALCGLIARHILSSERGSAKGIKFWDYRPFSRLLKWGRDFNQMNWYIKKNEYEARGLTTEKARYMVSIDKLWLKLVETLE